MSGKRRKALRREFRERTGCAPERATFHWTEKVRRFGGKMMSYFQRETLAPSEWRQIKKAYQARRAA